MGFLQPSEEFSACSDETFSLQVKLRRLRLDISEGSLDCLRKKKAKLDIPVIVSKDPSSGTPSFIFQNFDTKINVKNSPSDNYFNNSVNDPVCGKDKLSLDFSSLESSKISRLYSAFVKINCHSTTQNVNLSLIRLLLQVADMIDILGENYQEIKTGKNSREIFNNKERRDTEEFKAASENQKCWRIMYQVSDLYSALPSRYSPSKVDGEGRIDLFFYDFIFCYCYCFYSFSYPCFYRRAVASNFFGLTKNPKITKKCTGYIFSNLT